MKNFIEIIELWPSLTVFSKELEVKYVTAQKMRDRGSINQRYWKKLLSAAVNRGIALTIDDLVFAANNRQLPSYSSPEPG